MDLCWQSNVSAFWLFSRVDRVIGVFRHVAPPTRLRLELPHETGLILRCARKVGNPLHTGWAQPLPCGALGPAEEWDLDPVIPDLDL